MGAMKKYRTDGLLWPNRNSHKQNIPSINMCQSILFDPLVKVDLIIILLLIHI